ncbi:hypothetical protein GCM10023116_19120 [Kistimonas scapharcae]|uniref:Uncharacterized protein n=1 Tax=Kistimonas scapharcae TaxID=1036133 RepID=A0ABP8V1J0_9GAMM
MLVYSGNTSIDHDVFEVSVSGKFFKHVNPYALLTPAVITNINTMPFTEFLWQIAPRGTGTSDQ